jgi:hypothetical protein
MVAPDDAEQARRVIESHRDDTVSLPRPFGSEFEPLEERIGYRFRDRGLLEHALTHRSRVHEDASGGVFDNESMEFLGDSVLGFVIADMLFRQFPHHNEGQKSKLKASIVSAASLARLGERLGPDPRTRRGEDRRPPQGRDHRGLLRGAHRRHLSRRRHRPRPGLHPAAVPRTDRGSQADRRPRALHRGLQVRAPGVAPARGTRPADVSPRRRSRSRPPPSLRSRGPRRRGSARARGRAQQKGSGSSRGEGGAGSAQR